ncbi:MAG: ABC-F family ATP-binding cassette domain-containing protein, partial [bacterium]|nr:ABC-F family ATP-binding cassette domain-containing protein [bacterium]
MPLLHLENISKSYGAKTVLDEISWKIEPGEHLGLIGRNGCGKTTLFHLLTGRHVPDQGVIHRHPGLSVGHLTQDPNLPEHATVLQTALEAFHELMDLRQRLQTLEDRMSESTPGDALLEEYGRLHDRYERQGGYALEAQAKAILFGLGFGEPDLDRPVHILSGGQKNRLALAQLLAQTPDLLLLDEPTNHLDLQAIEWLESYLSGYGGAFVLISHDRYFLDSTVRSIFELERGQLHHYPGNYTFYTEEKQLRQEQQQKTYERQQTYIEETEEFIRRNIAGQKTKLAQSRRKSLEKLEKVEGSTRQRDMLLRFATSGRGGNRVLVAENISKSFNGQTLFQKLDLVVRRGDRLGIVGANGSGKSTLLKLLVNRTPSDTGTIALGAGIQIGYYDQARQDLQPEHTVLEEVWSVTPQAQLGEMRNFLGAFLFSGDDIQQKIGTLSGGEQSRVALAKLMRSQTNLLVLDEPTNHLDIPSCAVLEQALDGYDGTLLAVSHDRFFLNRLVNRLLVLDTGG